jgi:hypothetical protein
VRSVVHELVEITARLAALAARLAAEDAPDDMLGLEEAAKLAKCLRTLRDARRSGALTMFGGQRDRTVRRADLLRWIESRQAKPSMGPDDLDIDRRARRIERERNRT